MEKYEDRVVLFLDILGFRKIIESTEGESEEEVKNLDNLVLALQEMNRIISKMPKTSSKVVTQFSDSIVLSFKQNDAKEIRPLLNDVHELIASLVKRQILCRGAVSYGKLIHNSSMVIGPALIDAYLAESEAAIYPRVILDRSVIQLLFKQYLLNDEHMFRAGIFQSDTEANLRVDSDDKYYFDYFASGALYYRDETLLEYYEILRKTIQNGQKNKSQGIEAKYGWMKNKYNRIKNDFIKIDVDENLFDKRPDIKKFCDSFKIIN